MSTKRVLTLLGVAALYAIGGFSCAEVADQLRIALPKLPFNPFFYVPLPFAILSAALFLRTAKAWLAAPLNVAAFPVALGVLAFLDAIAAPFWARMCLAGATGGLLLALADSICHPRLLSQSSLPPAVYIGAIVALPFAAYESSWKIDCSGDFWCTWGLQCSFAIWQASLGTYLYAVCTHRDNASG